MRRIGRKWAVLVLLAAAAMALVAGRSAHVWSASQVQRAGGAYCTICLSVSAASSPTLYPGAAPASVPVTFTNLTNGPLYVTQLAVSLTNAFQPGCFGSEFSFDSQNFSGTSPSVTIMFSPAQTIPANSSWTHAATVSMPDNLAKQDGCQGQPLSLAYVGTANYTVLTTTALVETTNASSDTATFTATVSPDILPVSAGQTPGPSDGSVTFYECAASPSGSTGCTNPTNLGSSGLSPSGAAMLSIPAGSVGSNNYQAVYTPPAGSTNFVGSTSPILAQTISGCVNVATSGAGTIWTSGYVYRGSYTVASGTSLWLDGGTINGNVAVAAGGQFAATGGTVTGSVISSGGGVAMSATTVGGNVQTQGGGLSLGPTTVIKGNVQPGGGPFCSQGTALTQGQVQIRGNLTVQSLTSSTTSSVSATIVGNNLQWQSNASPGSIGASGPNSILGNLIVQNNTGAVTIGSSTAGNNTSGNIIVNANTGGGTITGNAAAGSCLLSADKPAIVGSGNMANPKGQNQCNVVGGA